MSNETNSGKHVGESLSGFIDGELTQQDAQRVRLHCENCRECGEQLEELRSLRERMGKASLSDLGKDTWRETMDDTTVKATRGIGWFLFAGAILLTVGFIIYDLLTDDHSMSLMQMLIIGGFYGGMLLLFLSVLRQRLIERKSDKYKDVEI
ncbi:MAG: anti-sigma factor family protein [Woeseiaceae bacterium]